MAEDKFLDKSGLARYDEKLKQRAVLATEIREIKIVTEYPEIEEPNVLYMKVVELEFQI